MPLEVTLSGMAQVGVIEMQTPRPLVMIGQFVHVGRSGHEAEYESEGTAAQREGLSHRSESSRIGDSAL